MLICGITKKRLIYELLIRYKHTLQNNTNNAHIESLDTILDLLSHINKSSFGPMRIKYMSTLIYLLYYYLMSVLSNVKLAYYVGGPIKLKDSIVIYTLQT